MPVRLRQIGHGRGKHRAPFRKQRRLLLRRMTSVAVSFAFVAGGLGTVAPAASAASLCEPPFTPGNVGCTLQQAALTEADYLVLYTEGCVGDNSSTVCYTIGNLFWQEVDATEQVASNCLAGSGLCGPVWDEARSLEDFALQCATLQPGTLCPETVSIAIAETQVLVGVILSTESQCLSGQNSVCQAVFDEYNAVAQAVGYCVNMTPGTLCPATIELARGLAFSAVGIVLGTTSSCLSGQNSTCQTILDTYSQVAQDFNNCTQMSPGTICPTAVDLALQEADAGLAFVTSVAGGADLTSEDGVTVDPTYVYVLSTDLVERHTSLEAGSAAAVAQLVALGASQAAPAVTDPTLAPMNSPAAVSSNGPPSSYNTYLAPEYQDNPHWCVPASAHNVLSSLGYNVTQSSLADSMGTQTSGPNPGTDPRKMPGVMNEFFNWYVWDNNVPDAMHLLNRTVDDTYYVGTALALAVQGEGLPWWRQHNVPPGRHMIAAYGYYTSGGGGLKLADPLNVSWAGYHNLSAAETYAAMSGNGNQMVW